MSRRTSGESGFTLVESLAAVALIGVGVLMCFSLLIPGGGLDILPEEAALRRAAAEDLLEETVALPFAEVRSRSISIPPESVGGRSGWTASIRVSPRGRHLKEVVVTVRGGDRINEARTLLAPMRAGS